MKRILTIGLVTLVGCTSVNPYEASKQDDRAHFKNVSMPFRSGTVTFISQGAFGRASHSEIGNEYSWDFDVPFGTEVLSVDAGNVIEIWTPAKVGGCDRTYTDVASNVKIEATDGTVAQYVHIDPKVKVGQSVKKGELIAVTAKNGFICQPQLHFGIYQSRRDLYLSPTRKTLPLLFEGIRDGVAKEGMHFTVP